MKISDFKIGEKYNRNHLREAFGGSFMGGINICKKTNTIVITSLHTRNRIYDDKLFEDDVMLYTGEGQIGDQKLIKGNKAIYEAKQQGRDIHLFVRFKKPEYTYYGKVETIAEPYYVDEKDVEGNIRKVIKFPMKQLGSKIEIPGNGVVTGGGGIIDKPILNVVGAAIINDKGEVLCAQRGHGDLIGKWEFPGGKINPGESETDAIIREIKEELKIDIEVIESIDENTQDNLKNTVNLKVFKCKPISGHLTNTEHQALKWVKPENMESLEWAPADKPIVETYLDSLPKQIDGEVTYDYFEAEAVKPNNKELQRAVQDYEKSQKAKQKSGDNAELAVLKYERDKLNNAGHPDLANLVKRVSLDNSAAGYDILSYEINNDNSFSEIHIEVKSAKKSNKYIEFFISENELNKFKEDKSHKIYCLIKVGRNYKLHEVNKSDFFKNNYLSPMTYRVRIRVAE